MIETIRVIGAGTMGRGIAQTAIAAGVTVELTDLSEQAVTAAVEFITAMMRRSVEKGARTSEEASAALDLLRTGAAPTDATDSVDLVVEADGTPERGVDVGDDHVEAERPHLVLGAERGSPELGHRHVDVGDVVGVEHDALGIAFVITHTVPVHERGGVHRPDRRGRQWASRGAARCSQAAVPAATTAIVASTTT